MSKNSIRLLVFISNLILIIWLITITSKHFEAGIIYLLLMFLNYFHGLLEGEDNK